MRPLYFLPLTSLLLFPACQKKQAAGPPQMPPAEVTFLPAATETVSITRELPGRIDPVRVAEVRARVGGILLEKTFQEGVDVKAGDVLFKIDPAPLEAVKENAAAALARADANLHQARTQLDASTAPPPRSRSRRSPDSTKPSRSKGQSSGSTTTSGPKRSRPSSLWRSAARRCSPSAHRTVSTRKRPSRITRNQNSRRASATAGRR